MLETATALPALRRLRAAAPGLLATLRAADPGWRGKTRMGTMRMVPDTDAAAYSVDGDGTLVVPVSFCELKLRQLLLTAAPCASSPPPPPSPLLSPAPCPPPPPSQPAQPPTNTGSQHLPLPREDKLPHASPAQPAPSLEQPPQNGQAEAGSSLPDAVAEALRGCVFGTVEGLRWLWDTIHRR